jgi:hypothetical protein
MLYSLYNNKHNCCHNSQGAKEYIAIVVVTGAVTLAKYIGKMSLLAMLVTVMLAVLNAQEAKERTANVAVTCMANNDHLLVYFVNVIATVGGSFLGSLSCMTTNMINHIGCHATQGAKEKE